MFSVKDLVECLEKKTSLWGMCLNEQQKFFFVVFCENLVRFSSNLGLVSAKNDELWEKHFLDSLRPLPYLLKRDDKSVLDIGSGGGFPGMCLAIMMPDVQFTLCECNKKKAGFLLSTMYLMGIRNVEILPCSYQEIKRNFDICISRAVLHIMPKNIKKILRITKTILCYKGQRSLVERDCKKLQEQGIPVRIDDLADDSFSFVRTLLWIGNF